MALRVQSLINFCLLGILVSCTTAQETLALIEVHNPSLRFKNQTVYYNNNLFSGILYELHGNDTLNRAVYKDGRLNGKYQEWYTDGNTKAIRYFTNGNKTGRHLGWWENGKQQFDMEYENDVFSGNLYEWNEEGLLYHHGYFLNGQEEGLQKFWRPNGKLYANYVVKDGRQYGLVGTKNCVNVKDSI